MYSPKIKEDLIPLLYKLAREKKKPMTKVVDEILRSNLNEPREESPCQKKEYESAETLRALLSEVLRGRKFELDCGHRVTFGHNLGNDITIYNGNRPKVICSLCSY